MKTNALIPAVLALAMLSPALAAPDVEEAPSPEARPRIGLALGGGGARGAAHVGVLRVLEELQIPIDCVSGTSMGSIVGALYALGLPSDEIERELLAVDWADLFVDRPPRELRPMRRKDDDRDTFFPFELGLKGMSLTTPRGFIAGQKFAFAFPEPGLLTAGHRSFDDLPIPYRAVATDLLTGERVVLDHGNLLQAVRASMSIPGVFPPVERRGRLLVDGYLTSNVPVDAVRAMGADIVIAVEVGRRMEDTTREELKSIGGIQEQADRIRSQLALAEELGRADMIIRPKLEQWSGQEYDRLAEIMEPGEAAAREQLEVLRILGTDSVSYRAWRDRVEGVIHPLPAVNRVELDNRTRVPDDVILDRLAITRDAPFNRPSLKVGVEKIYELGVVERTDFALESSGGEGVLSVTVNEKPYAPNTTFLGGSYRMNEAGNSPFSVLLRVNRLEVNGFGAEWRTDISFGTVLGLRSEIYQPLDRLSRRWFVAPSVEATVRNDGLFWEDKFLGDYKYQRILANLDLGSVVSRDLELRAGVMAGQLSTEWASGIFPIPKIKHEVAGVRAGLLFDSLDDHRVPHHGVKFEAQYFAPQDVLWSKVHYDRLWGQGLLATSNRHGTFILDVQGGTYLSDPLPFYAHYYLGGLRGISGEHVGRRRGSVFTLASAGWLHRLGGGTLPLANKAYLGLWLDAGNTWNHRDQLVLDDLIYSGAISLLVETYLGPLHIGYGRSEDGTDALHIDFGIHLGSALNR